MKSFDGLRVREFRGLGFKGLGFGGVLGFSGLGVKGLWSWLGSSSICQKALDEPKATVKTDHYATPPERSGLLTRHTHTHKTPQGSLRVVL